ncbi:MoaD/ThiS family protein [Candidatus Bathyarchaeota archaeon]|nr:MoaD/ThiS family protein [Candidatus Bathyarchaeota archaeon]
MIKVTLILLDERLKKEIGKKEIAIELHESEATVRCLLRKAVMQYGDKTLESILKPETSIFLNGQNVEFLGGLEAKLSEGDRVAIVPLIEGGSQ